MWTGVERALTGVRARPDHASARAEEAAKEFSLDRVVKSGARFNPDKAKWFQEQHLRGSGSAPHVAALQKLASEKGLGWDEAACMQVLNMMLERVTFLHDIVDTAWLHAAPTDFNAKLVKKKWKYRFI